MFRFVFIIVFMDRWHPIQFIDSYTVRPLKHGCMRPKTLLLPSEALFHTATIRTTPSRFVKKNVLIQTATMRYHKSMYDTSYQVPSTSLWMGTYDPDPSILVSSKSNSIQRVVFTVCGILLGIGTKICIDLWTRIGMSGLTWFDTIRTLILPIALGSLYSFVGIIHFTMATNMARIVPPKGTWGGLWQAPTPGRKIFFPNMTYEAYHNYWTGVVEIITGSWLFIGALFKNITSIQLPARILFYLTIMVSPANIYMFTHNANNGENMPKAKYPESHIMRFIIQCIFLSSFWIMSNSP